MLVLILIVLAFFNIFFSLTRCQTILNPLIFYTIGWVSPFMVAILMQSTYQVNLSNEFLFFLFFITFLIQILLIMPMVIGKKINTIVENQSILALYHRKISIWQRRYFLILFFSIIALAISFIDIQTIPILDNLNYKSSRRLLRESFFYNFYTVSIIAVPMIIYIATKYKKTLTKIQKTLILIWFILSSMTGWVGNIVYPLIMSISTYSIALKDKGKEKKPVFITFSLVILFFLFVSFLRSIYNLDLNSEFSTLLDERTWGRFFTYLAYPFYNMQEIYFSSEIRSYGINIFYFLSSIPLLGPELKEAYENWFNGFQTELGENIYARGANTLTFIAPLFFDFGHFGLIFIFVLALLYGYLYRLVIHQHNFLIAHWKIALYSGFSMVIFMLFTGLHTRMFSFYVWPILAILVQRFPSIKVHLK